ncbi:GGDEF domain-containing protein [Pseudonocardiaceae bacterium YIM PH 21723]|nr:GGDEF domain-containing protein [Pseudonocardiaceae bacterium YIM PH 21723]
MLALTETVRYAFQPLVNLNTGGMIAIEALARPTEGRLYDMYRQAAKAGQVAEFDLELAIGAVRSAADHDAILPLHLNLLAGTVARNTAGMARLSDVLAEVGRHPQDVVLEIGSPFSRIDPHLLLTKLRPLRAEGYPVCLDGVGGGDLPLSLLAEVAPDMMKLDRTVVSGLTEDDHRDALLDAIVLYCQQTGIQLLAEGVFTEQQLNALRRKKVHIAQGDLLAPAKRRPPTTTSVAGLLAELVEPDEVPVSAAAAGPMVTDYLYPATVLPVTATADEVRQMLANQQGITSVVLADETGRPQSTIDRNRFLLAVTGPYGHALHANRAASRLADEPRTVSTYTTSLEALDIVATSAPERTYDDIIVVDEAGRCLGAVRVSDLFRGMAEMKVEEAAALNPLTRLPGTDAIAHDVTLKLSENQVFAVSWLDVDSFKHVNDTAGFSAGDDLIRSIGRGLTDAAAALGSVFVSHVGGDDFLFVTDLDDLVPLATMLLDVDRTVEGMGVTMSVATIVCTPGSVTEYREVSRALAPLKRQAKSLRGNSWVVGRPGSEHIDVLRGRPVSPVPDPRLTQAQAHFPRGAGGPGSAPSYDHQHAAG